MGKQAHLGYTINDVRGIESGKDIMLWGPLGAAFVTEDEFVEVIDKLLDSSEEENKWRHITQMPLKGE